MGLAILEPDDIGSDGQRWFRFDIGSAPFYRFAVGGPERRRLDGISLIDRPVWISPMLGPLAPQNMGRGRFGIDESLFNREAEFVQMMSYRSATREGPAVSAIMRSRRPLPTHGPTRGPAIAMARPSMQPRRPMIRGSRAPVEAMSFWSILSGLAPMVGQLLGGIGNIGTVAATPTGGSDILQRLADPATLRMLNDLIGQIGRAPAPPAAPPAPIATQQSVRYSHAQIAPALLAALPALAPLLQQVLSPQTIQTLVDAPNRSAQTIINGITDVMKLGILNNQAEDEHLRKLNPGVDDASFDRLLAGLGLGKAGRRAGRDWLRTTRVRLAFDGLRSVTVAGVNQVVFAQDRAISLPMLVDLPTLKSGKAPRLAEAELMLEVKDPNSLAVVKRLSTPVSDIAAAGPAGTITLPADQVAQLEAGRDWLLSVSLSWKGPKTLNRRRLGCVMTQIIHLAGPYMFNALHDEGPAIDLADPARYRPFWHKVWAGRFEADAKRFETEVDYRYGWDADAHDTLREDSDIRTRPAERSVASIQARVKSGLTLTPEILAGLAAQLDPGAAPLDPDVRVALQDPLLAQRLALGARAMVTLRGRKDEAFALWTYPAVRRATLSLLQPSDVLDNGNVIAFATREWPFAVPVAINLVGTRAR